MPRKGAQAKAFAAQQAKKREAEKQEARAKVDAEKNNAKGISECRDVGQLMRMHRANSERIEHMEEAQEKEAKRKEAERAAKEKELEESQGKSWWDRFLPKPKGPREATSPNKVQQQRDNIEQFYDLLKCSKHVKREIQAVFKAFDANKDGSLNINEFRTYLKEPKERMPFLNRIFLSMDDDAIDGAERVNTYGVGELDMFEFFVVDQRPLRRWRRARRWRTGHTPSPRHIINAGRLLLHLLLASGRLRYSFYLGLVRPEADGRDRLRDVPVHDSRRDVRDAARLLIAR